jgi:hypothetical protein
VNVDVRDEEVGALLDGAVTHVDVEGDERLGRVRRRGGTRRAIRWTAIVVALAVFVGSIGLTAVALRTRATTPAGPGQIGRTITIPYANGSLTLPPGWYGVSAQGMNADILMATTNRDALEGLVTGCEPESRECGWKSLDVADLDATDAFVEVQGASIPKPPGGPVLPSNLESARWTDQPGRFSEYVRQITGRGPQGGVFTIRWWVGPDAGEGRRAQTHDLLDQLQVTTPQSPRVSPPPPSSDTTVWQTVMGGGPQFSIRRPPYWHVQTFSRTCLFRTEGVLIGNADRDFVAPPQGTCGSGWDLRDAPPDLVLVEIGHDSGGPTPTFSPEPDSAFPLSLTDASDQPPSEFTPQRSWQVPLQIAGDNRWHVTVWYGAGASEHDLGTAADVVASIAFDYARLTAGGPVVIPWTQGELELPDHWYGMSGAGGATSPQQGLLATTAPLAAAGHIEGCHIALPDCVLEPIDPTWLAPTDAYVNVTSSCTTTASTSPLIPAMIDPSSFTVGADHMGSPAMFLVGRTTGCWSFSIEYWVGPEASTVTRDQALTLIRSLAIPGPWGSDVAATIVISKGLGTTFDPPGDAPPSLSADQALATYTTANAAADLPRDLTGQLGLVTGDGYAGRLAWGYSWRSCTSGVGGDVATTHPILSCTAWLFLDANTGTMLFATWQQGA